MGRAHERLSVAELEREDLLAVSHLHRYELAAELLAGERVLDLCCGTGYGSRLLAARARSVHGVDVAPEAVEAARAALTPGEHDRVTFEQADALAHVRGLAAGQFDAVVCFEGVEHVPDPDALLDELARLAEGGAKLLVSLPNSRGFEEQNEFHVTDYGYEEMQAAAARLGGAHVIEQWLAEASVFAEEGGEGELELAGRLRLSERADGAWANHWLLVTGVEPGVLDGARARLSLAASAAPNAYIRLLEKANADLYRHNTRLARARLGVHDAAAAAVLRRVEETRAEARHWEDEARKWEAIADQNDWARVVAERRLDRRSHRIVDAVMDRITGLPGVRQARRLGRRA